MRRRYLVVVLGVVALEMASGAAATPVAAQGTQPPKQQQKADSIPREYRPPAGMCRIWIDGVPPAQQPAPTTCAAAVRNKPSNGRVVYGDEKKKGTAKDSAAEKLPIKSFKPVTTKRPPKGKNW
jgi:hypothetical protein